MTLSSCGCKVPWALRGGNGECGSCGSLGRCRRCTTSSAAAWTPAFPYSRTAPLPSTVRLPICGLRAGDGGCGRIKVTPQQSGFIILAASLTDSVCIESRWLGSSACSAFHIFCTARCISSGHVHPERMPILS